MQPKHRKLGMVLILETQYGLGLVELGTLHYRIASKELIE